VKPEFQAEVLRLQQQLKADSKAIAGLVYFFIFQRVPQFPHDI
jgi:hypothetical protein